MTGPLANGVTSAGGPAAAPSGGGSQVSGGASEGSATEGLSGTLQRLKRILSPAWPGPALAIGLSLCPLGYCLLRGSMGASLWLDEILYYHFERRPEIRAIEMWRPGSIWPRVIGPFAYADVQRAIHKLFDFVGFHLTKNPELYLRLPSLTYFAIAVIVLYFIALKRGGDKLWAFGVALAFGSTPAFLFYAFEARVYSLAALLVVAWLAVLWRILEGHRERSLVAWGAVLGLAATWAHLWDVCLLAGVAACLPLVVWRDAEHWRKGARVALVVGFGIVLAFVQAGYVLAFRMPGKQHGIPLLDPQPLKSLILSTVYGPFLGLLRGDPEYVLGILLAISLFRGRGKLGWVPAASVWMALALSIVLMARFGWGISPRHQTPLYAGIFVCLASTRAGLVSKALLANLIGLNLVLLPATVDRIEKKANSKQIARVIGAGERLRQFPVVVQHSYALGYPDPLHTFALVLYLDLANPEKAPASILELPTHRDVRDVLLDRDYFVAGREKLETFASAPVDQWIGFLKDLPDRAIWLVAPASSRNLAQRKKYELALGAAGFSRVRGVPEDFEGYPSTKLMLWKRAGTSDNDSRVRVRR